jgi:hypothetical protein
VSGDRSEGMDGRTTQWGIGTRDSQFQCFQLQLPQWQRGFVLVGNVPTSGGMIQKPGSLLFLDRDGKEVAPSPYSKRLNGPWDLTIDDMFDHAVVFVSNVNTGTVTRLNLASNFRERGECDQRDGNCLGLYIIEGLLTVSRNALRPQCPNFNRIGCVKDMPDAL